MTVPPEHQQDIGAHCHDGAENGGELVAASSVENGVKSAVGNGAAEKGHRAKMESAYRGTYFLITKPISNIPMALPATAGKS